MKRSILAMMAALTIAAMSPSAAPATGVGEAVWVSSGFGGIGCPLPVAGGGLPDPVDVGDCYFPVPLGDRKASVDIDVLLGTAPGVFYEVYGVQGRASYGFACSGASLPLPAGGPYVLAFTLLQSCGYQLGVGTGTIHVTFSTS